MSLSPEVQAQLDAVTAQQAKITASLGSPPGPTAVEVLGNPTVPATPRNHDDEGRWGFQSFNQFRRDVYDFYVHRRPSERIVNAYKIVQNIASTTGMNETFGSDGGFLVPTTFLSKIMERIYDNESFLSWTDSYTTAGNSIAFPRNSETSRADGSRWGGVQAYWEDEGETHTASKPKFGKFQINLHKLITYSPLTEELREDAGPAAEQYLTRVFSEEINFTIGKAIFAGTGVGQPAGLKNSPATVAVAAETGQTSSTPILYQNILAMYARLWAPSVRRARWLINQSMWPYLQTMTLGTGIANVPVYLPPGGASTAPYGTLLGLPIYPIEYAEAPNTQGDITLWDPTSYITLTKGTGPQSMSSMHFLFDTDRIAFKTTFRLGGAPWWASVLTPYKDTTKTQSTCLQLATRS